MFYDEDWRELSRKFPLIAKKIEELRCEVVNYEEYQEKVEELQRQISELKDLLRKNGIKIPTPLAVAAP